MDDEIIFSNEKNGSGRIPNQKELEKELSDYLSKKYGGRVKIISPLVFPKPDDVSSDDKGDGTDTGNLPSFDLLPEELESYLDGFVVKPEIRFNDIEKIFSVLGRAVVKESRVVYHPFWFLRTSKGRKYAIDGVTGQINKEVARTLPNRF